MALGVLVKTTYLEQEFPSLLGPLHLSCPYICTGSEQSEVVLRRQGSPRLFYKFALTWDELQQGCKSSWLSLLAVQGVQRTSSGPGVCSLSISR